MDKSEYKFPDEMDKSNGSGKEEPELKIEIEAEGETEIEIVNDLPKSNKKMEEPPKDADEEELSQYGEKVRKRIQHLQKGYHEEKRKTEQAIKEKEEAIKLAQAIYEENKKLKGSFDFILSTISAQHDYNQYLDLLKVNGTMVVVGVPPVPSVVNAFSIIGKRRSLAGSMIGGIKETQEMLDYCAEHQIVSDVEVIKMSQINEAYERVIKSDVRYRFVIEIASLS
jgi:hypothetical protein